ncbi:MAG: hypothetical protein ACK4M9_03140 [Anaerobacillus sp.]
MKEKVDQCKNEKELNNEVDQLDREMSLENVRFATTNNRYLSEYEDEEVK